jgi:hypothetical protein
LTVVLPGDSLSPAEGHPVEPATSDLLPPLVVAGTVHGSAVQALVAGLPDVLAQIAVWTADDPEAVGSWGLRGDYSEPLIMPVLLRDETAGEAQQAVHLVRLQPGDRHGRTLTAMCGQLLPLVSVTAMEVGVGMPCQPCLTRHIAFDTTRDHGGLQGAIRGRLDRQIG